MKQIHNQYASTTQQFTSTKMFVEEANLCISFFLNYKNRLFFSITQSNNEIDNSYIIISDTRSYIFTHTDSTTITLGESVYNF